MGDAIVDNSDNTLFNKKQFMEKVIETKAHLMPSFLYNNNVQNCATFDKSLFSVPLVLALCQTNFLFD